MHDERRYTASEYETFGPYQGGEKGPYDLSEEAGGGLGRTGGLALGIGLLAVAAAGAGYLGYRYWSEPSRRRRHEMLPGGSILARASTTVDRPVEQVYATWRDLESLPEIMSHLESVRELPDGRSRWTAVGPGGFRIEWEAELVEERENERLSWESSDDAPVPNEGSVRFRQHPLGGTEIHVSLFYHPPGGRLAQGIASMFGKEPTQQLRDDLRRFKQRLEAGQVITNAYSRPSARET